jgi:hypothetical protein
VIFIWGSSNQESREPGHVLDCPRCGPGQSADRLRTRRFFTFFFLPLFPVRDLGEALECRRCGGRFDLAWLSSKGAAQAGATTALPQAPPRTEDPFGSAQRPGGTARWASPPVASPADRPEALAKVRTPAILTMVTAVASLLAVLALALSQAVAPGRAPGAEPKAEWLVWALYGLSSATAVAVFAGGLRMLQLRSYGLACVGAILMLIPGFFPCCFLGLPLGMWSLVILTQPRVKAQFDASF